MTVGELVEALSRAPLDREVVVRRWGRDWDEPNAPKIQVIQRVDSIPGLPVEIITDTRGR